LPGLGVVGLEEVGAAGGLAAGCQAPGLMESWLGPVALLVSHVCPSWVFRVGMTTESVLAEKLAALRPVLDERQWRLLLGAEAQSLGHGGIAVVARA
jgi:hypothetical protein